MKGFSHPHLAKMRPRWAVSAQGGLVIEAWQLVPSVPVDPNDPAFDQSKLDALGEAAVMHAKAHGQGYKIEIVEI